MSPRLFLSQAAVERWAADGRADVSGDALVAQGGALHGARFALEPALRVVGVAGGGEDPHGLVAKVRRAADLRAAGAEIVGGSVLLGDVAYEAEPGFLAEPPADAIRLLFPPSIAAESEPSLSPEQAPAGTPLEGQSDAASLARYLLNHLS